MLAPQVQFVRKPIFVGEDDPLKELDILDHLQFEEDPFATKHALKTRHYLATLLPGDVLCKNILIEKMGLDRLKIDFKDDNAGPKLT